ncbi:hypothetical protein [Crateriforma conspicua]|uniref:Uncharacterized protein n=1 Tax=Crateriforma conspicua TaxID=2527996 RepID=A0A5C5Y126_9PLAN|nr:hypothetical protein [Crateriforma conspicua]TWT68333.1 hypothetical protein Pan14r_05770 [Crateriforma conspicua]
MADDTHIKIPRLFKIEDFADVDPDGDIAQNEGRLRQALHWKE